MQREGTKNTILYYMSYMASVLLVGGEKKMKKKF